MCTGSLYGTDHGTVCGAMVLEGGRGSHLSYNHWHELLADPEKEIPMKRKILFLTEAILLPVLLLFCFFGSGEVSGTDSCTLQREEETGELVSDTFSLKPGVYRIIVEADAAGGGIGAGMEIGLNAEQMTFHAIRGSRAALYAGTEHKEITYYVTAPVEGAYVSILPFSENAEVSYELRVERTAAGSRMTFVMTVLLCGILNGLLAFHRKIMTGEVSAGKKWTACALAAIWAVACIPLMVDYLILGTDSVQCLTETEQLLRGEWGTIPFLHLLYLWIPAAVRGIGFPVMTAYKVLFVLLTGAATLLIYGVFFGQTKDVRLALSVTALGVWSPLAMKWMYTQGNPGKLVIYVLAYALLGLIVGWILGKKKTADRKISPWILFTVSLVLILQVLYFEDNLTFQSDVYYWYNEEAFMTGE